MSRTANDASVSDNDANFLIELLRYHDEWHEKSSGGICDISVQTTAHGSRCFVLRKKDGSAIDISFPHAVLRIPSGRSISLVPQALLDFRSAARTAIEEQIWAFRDQALQSVRICSVTGEEITRKNAAIDHVFPDTFDQLLFRFCQCQGINPLRVSVGSQGGVVATFEDQQLLADWRSFHATQARLRLISKRGNLQLEKSRAPWTELGS